MLKENSPNEVHGEEESPGYDEVVGADRPSPAEHHDTGHGGGLVAGGTGGLLRDSASFRGLLCLTSSLSTSSLLRSCSLSL